MSTTKPPKSQKPQFILHLQAEKRPGDDDDGNRRLRALLKFAGRVLGLKCLAVRGAREGESIATPPNPTV